MWIKVENGEYKYASWWPVDDKDYQRVVETDQLYLDYQASLITKPDKPDIMFCG